MNPNKSVNNYADIESNTVSIVLGCPERSCWLVKSIRTGKLCVLMIRYWNQCPVIK